MKLKRKPFFGPGIRRTKAEQVKLFKQSMASFYSLPKRNPEFDLRRLIFPGLLYSFGYGIIVFFLIKWQGASTPTQVLSSIFAVCFGLFQSVVSEAWVMGHMTERLILLGMALVTALLGVYIVNDMGW